MSTTEPVPSSGTSRRPGSTARADLLSFPGGRFFVASELSDEVYAFGRNENATGSFDAPGTLDGPTSIALSPSGDEIYVGSFQNGSVCVFDLNGTFQRAFTAPGLTTVNCVAFDSAGNIFVSSASGSDDVFKFDSNETLLTSFSAPGTTLTSSMGIAIDANDFLYVAGGASHNICLFTNTGGFLAELTQAGMTGPQGIALDDRGHFFTPSFFADRIFEFDPTGAHVQTITAGGLDTPRSIAFVQRRFDRSRYAGDVTVDTAPTRSPVTWRWPLQARRASLSV